MHGRNGTRHRYHYCRNHDPIRAGGEDRRCPERNIRADALDAFVFDQIRIVLTQPELLLAGEQAVTMTTPIPDDELLTAELSVSTANRQHRRRAPAAGRRLPGRSIDLPNSNAAPGDVTARQRDLQTKRASLADQRSALARGNQLRHRVDDFADRIHQIIDQLNDVQKQQLLRLLIEEVRVTGWHVQIQLRIALDPPGPGPQHPSRPTDPTAPNTPHVNRRPFAFRW